MGLNQLPPTVPLSLLAHPVTESVLERVSNAVKIFQNKKGRAPSLATILVGDDPSSMVYVKKKGEMCRTLGLGHQDFKLPHNTTQSHLMDLVSSLSENANIDGILVQKPLPEGFTENLVFDSIVPEKDVDCFSPYNTGLLTQGRGRLLPCTPSGVMEILRFYKITTAGKRALVIGRSDIVGKPMGLLLLQADATVTYAHSRTKDLGSLIAEADIVVAAIGKACALGDNFPWQRHTTVIDVGIHRGANGKLCGDIDFTHVAPKVAAITPVPGGVGPMTIAMLMVNTVRAAFHREKLALPV